LILKKHLLNVGYIKGETKRDLELTIEEDSELLGILELDRIN
jgi:hypothetical protein